MATVTIQMSPMEQDALLQAIATLMTWDELSDRDFRALMRLREKLRTARQS